MRTIFLDIDGVLNDDNTCLKERTPEGYAGVESKYIKVLKYIVDKTGAEIVLSSDWRAEWHHNGKHGEDMRYLCKKLSDEGLTIADKTPGNVKGKGFSGRGLEIAKYLKDHPEITDYVILDDNDFFDFSDAPAKGHVVITVTGSYVTGRYRLGLTKEQADTAINILLGGFK